jgi:hypothetical protein
MADDFSKELSGILVGQEMALVLLVKLLHQQGVVDANAYVRSLKLPFNDPDARVERVDYRYLQSLANTLAEELDLPS